MASNQPALSRFLDRLLRRSALDDEEQNAILGLSSYGRQYRANIDIVSPGETVHRSCLVARGLTSRYDQMANGQRQLNAFHVPGDMCDLHSVACPTAAWGIVALTATTVLQVPHPELRTLAEKYPRIAFAFWRDATVDASILAKWVGNLGRRDARARVAHLLCEMGVRMEAADVGTRYQFWFDVTQVNLADAVGLTPVHVNRTLQSLRSDGLIRSEGHMIYVHDWEGLTRIAEFNPDYLLLRCGAKSKLDEELQRAVANLN